MPTQQGSNAPQGSPDPGAQVQYLNADARSRAAFGAIHAEEPCKRLHHGLIARMQLHGAGMAVGPDRAIHQSGVQRADGVGTQSHLFQGTGAQVLNQYIRIGQIVLEPGDRSRIFQIERNAPLVAVHRVKGGRGVLPERWPPSPGIVATLGPLDLDHVRAQGREDFTGVGAGQVLSNFHHFDAGQRQCDTRLLRGRFGHVDPWGTPAAYARHCCGQSRHSSSTSLETGTCDVARSSPSGLWVCPATIRGMRPTA